MKITHERVARRKQDADVAGNARDDQRLRFQIIEQRVEGCRKEAGVLRFQNEIIIFIRLQELDDRLATHSIVQTMTDQLAQIRLPFPEVVVDVDDGNACLLGSPLQRGNLLSHRQRMFEKRLCLFWRFKLEIVDQVNQQQGGRGVVRNVAVQVLVFRGHSPLK